jgi:hypothetical protein
MPEDGEPARQTTMSVTTAQQIAGLKGRLDALDRERSEIAVQLAALEHALVTQPPARMTNSASDVVQTSPAAIKVAIFRSLFRGREDVFPRRWENANTGKSGYAPACRNEWVRGVCRKPVVKCGECPNQAFVPISDEMLRCHLEGRNPGSPADFTAGVYPMLPDETCWFLAADFDKTSWMRDVAAFRGTARAYGVFVAVERSRSGNGAHAWIFFAEPVPASEARRLGALLITATMDRCPDIGFDSYDRFFPSQDTMPTGGFGNLIALPLQNRPRAAGNSLFVDDEFQPYDDQWAFLASVTRLSQGDLTKLVLEAAAAGRVLGVRLPITDEDGEPWAAPPPRRKSEPPIEGTLPESVEVVLGNQVYVDRSQLPPVLVNRLLRLAAFQNPEFYAAQAMRLPTFGKPRIISCAELFSKHVALPRGCLDAVLALLEDTGIAVQLRDERQLGRPIGVRFLGELTPDQEAAFVSFEAIAREAKARFVLGLSATVTRKDGHHPIIFMQCGPVRHRVDARRQAAARPFEHKVVFRHTAFSLLRSNPDRKATIQDYYAQLAANEARNDLILSDIRAALDAWRSPVVITERKDHVALLANRLVTLTKNVVVLQGGMGVRQARAVGQYLADIAEGEVRVLVATGRYLGEGFDDARLDTLFLTLPISWRGTLAQYAGRLHRLHAAKRVALNMSTPTSPCSRRWLPKGRQGIGPWDTRPSRSRTSTCSRPCLRMARSEIDAESW